MLLQFLYIVQGGVTELVFYNFRVIIGIIGGTPYKRISEGLFCPLFFCCFLVFIGIIGGPLVNVFLRVYFDFFFFFFLGVLQALQGGPLINVFLRVYFDVFGQSLRFNFRPSKQSSFYVFWVLQALLQGGPDKRISECLF